MNNQALNTQKIIVDAPSELHRKFKTLATSDGSSIKKIIVSLMENYVENGLPQKGDENGNPGAEVSLLDKRINELLEAKLSGLVKAEDGKVDGAKPDGAVDPEDKIFITKPMKDPEIKVHRTKERATTETPHVAQENGKDALPLVDEDKVATAEKRGFFNWFLDGGNPVQVQVAKEKLVAVEDGLIARNGVVAREIIIGKKILIDEKAQALVRAKKVLSGFKFPHDLDDEYYDAFALVEASQREKKEADVGEEKEVEAGEES